MLTRNLCKPGLWVNFLYHWTWSAVGKADNPFENVDQIFIKIQSTRVVYKCYETWIFGWWVVFETFDYIIINESECLQQMYLLKTFQRNVFSCVISQKKKKKKKIE